MKRQILTIATVLALVLAGAALAQNPLNTTAPGPTTQQNPGQTNNDLPNPGNPVPAPTNENTTATPPTTAAPQDTMVHPETEPAAGAVNVDVTTKPDSDTDASGTGTETTGTYGGSETDNAALPSTASDLPSVALLGLLALGAAFAVRMYSKRNA